MAIKAWLELFSWDFDLLASSSWHPRGCDLEGCFVEVFGPFDLSVSTYMRILDGILYGSKCISPLFFPFHLWIWRHR
jgi:hypothetical protein